MAFASKLIAWQRRHGRRGLPWQGTRDPYRVWLSEIMLQQTQVAAVIPYYERFLARFPTVRALAAAPQDEVLALWSGLGYYARARNLHAAAKLVAEQGFPAGAAALERLPGVGRSTAAAIAAFAYGERVAILDGNVKRVLARHFGVEGEKAQWALAGRLLPARGIETYTQALMDLGATVCVRAAPRCGECPLARDCHARREDRVDQLPSRRGRGPVPERKATWHIVRCNGEVLLERRAARGLWGGLWVFPETRPTRQKGRALEPFEHGFTHFRLRVRPILYDVKKRPDGGWWVPIEDALAGAVPAPVRKVLKALPAARR
ncbi:MAG TPA: A/G-specific adenine glycosylase [Burkholderiales bacterium]|nr:A/G-specific adenine glycosylase [Burkholderiales bacterium]